ncbi:MAG: T9SS type A sorting domain-containing protein, partial [Bacteroidales bacterium]|nr:T9SS type A sorting domain-containing protein [Bacteroidales bacterium]
EKGVSERYLRQLRYDPVLKQNVLANTVYEIYSRNIYGNTSEILYHGWINNNWEVNGKAIFYYSLIDGKKVSICHNGKTICVSTHAVRAHLEHGDKLGACPVVPESNQVEPESFTIYPNPVRELMTIGFRSENHTYTNGYLIAAGGRVVQSFEAAGRNEITLNVSSLKPGSYFIKLIGANSTDSQTFIKK